MGDDGGRHCLVQMEWRPAGWSVCLPLLIFPLHHKVQKFSSGTSSPGWSRKKGRKTVVVVVLCKRFPGAGLHLLLFSVFLNTELSDWLGITLKNYMF